ncbi:MAG: response regulator [Myxococcaceae bacterium]|nr:response regulator [Myxococcaceae bacterium]
MHLVTPPSTGPLTQADAFRELVERMPLPAMIRRGARVVLANTALARVLGREPKDLEGGSLLNMLHAAERQHMHQHLVVSKPGETSTPRRALKWLRRNGLAANLEVEVIQDVIFEGAPAVLWVMRDMSEQRNVDARLQVAERLASVGTMAAGVAHEINNPLSFIINNVTFLQRELRQAAAQVQAAGVDTEEWEQALRESLEGATRVRDIVRDMKTFSRANETDVTACDVDQILDGAIKLGWNEIRHRAQLNKHCQNIPPVKGNPGRLGQVFLNLLVNAAQAIPDGAVDKNTIDVLVESTADDVTIEIFDTGVGMSPEQLGRIFDPFYTTKPVGVGTGLGLSICHGIVTDLGGTIDVQSSPGHGSVFRVTLPRASPPRAETPVPSVLVAPLRVGQAALSVLVVDDDELVARGIRRALGARENVQYASSASVATQRFNEGQQDFDLILCDLMMPEVSGEKFYRQVAERWPELAKRFVFITGGAFSEDARAFLSSTSCPWLEKPLDGEKIERVVQSARRRRQA